MFCGQETVLLGCTLSLFHSSPSHFLRKCRYTYAGTLSSLRPGWRSVAHGIRQAVDEGFMNEEFVDEGVGWGTDRGTDVGVEVEVGCRTRPHGPGLPESVEQNKTDGYRPI